MSDQGREEATTASPFTVTLPSGDTVGAIAYPAAGKVRSAGTTMILAHGAGAPQTHPFMTAFARLLSARGIDVVTFNFLYMERGRRVPDPRARLEGCYRAVIAAARARAGDGERRMVIGGKSMGGRIATQVAAAQDVDGSEADMDGADASVDALVLLGYPLHPPGRPDKPRTAHLPSVVVPMLFVQGERDAFGTPEELRPVLATCADAELVTVDGGDHSLRGRGKNAPPAADVYESVTGRIVGWLEEHRLLSTPNSQT